MSRSTYIGIEALARCIRGAYIGVDGVARKLRKTYIGVDGLARLCWTRDSVASSPTVTTQTLIVINSNNENDIFVFTMPAGFDWYTLINSEYNIGGAFSLDGGDDVLYNNIRIYRPGNAPNIGVNENALASGTFYYAGEVATDETTDLTGTTWEIPEGWSATAGYGYFNVDIYWCPADFEPDLYGMSSTVLAIGFEMDVLDEGPVGYAPESDVITLSNFDMLTPITGFKLEFGGGKDVTNPSLIAWLSEHGKLISSEEPEEPSLVLPAPTISIYDTTMLSVHDESGLAEEFDIVVDGEVVKSVRTDDVPTPVTHLYGDILTISGVDTAEEIEVLANGKVVSKWRL